MTEEVVQVQGIADMEMTPSAEVSTNASASAYGWEFQKAAGVLLMLEFLKQCESLNVEGNTEDIELKLSQGRYIYAQAKSMEKNLPADNRDENYYNAADRHLKKGISTLTKAARKANTNGEKIESLLYLFNMVAPFGMIRPTMHIFRGGDEYEYDALSTHEQNRIQAKLKSANGEDLLPVFKEKFAMRCMEFSKVRKHLTKYHEIYHKLQTFLASVGINPFLSDELLTKLRAAIDDVVIGADFALSKDDVISMALELKMRIVETDFKEIFKTQFSLGKTRRMFKLYRETISSLSGSYFISNKINSEFKEEYSENYDENDMIQFACNNPSLVDDCVFASSNEYSEEEIKLVKSALIYKMLDERMIFDNVMKQCYE